MSYSIKIPKFSYCILARLLDELFDATMINAAAACSTHGVEENYIVR